MSARHDVSLLRDVIAARIDRHGPISFDRYLDLALYHPHGFYSAGGVAGRRGDFITSPEVGPLFGAAMARAIDACWDDLGQPPVFVVVECGAGPGTLARAVLAATPRCAAALRYVLVERSDAQRELHRSGLPLEAAIGAFPTAHGEEEPPDASGPIAVSLGELPREAVIGMVIANELLDNLPFALCHRAEGRWFEVLVGRDGDRFVEVLVDAPQGHRELAEALAPDSPDGARIPVQIGVWAWLADALAMLDRGRVVCIDYARTTDVMAAEPDWLRTYRGHERGGHPLEAPGTQDITSDVALDQLIRVKRPTRTSLQHEFLRIHGIDELVEQGRREWEAGAHLGNLAALRGRSRVREAEALLDPNGLGGFTVMEWAVAI